MFIEHSRVIPVAAAFAVLVIAASGRIATSYAADSATEAEYQQRFQALDAKDVDGHVELALWCRDKEAYDLLLLECNLVLSLDPNHRMAKLLHRLATRKLKGDQADDTGGGGGPTGDQATTASGVKLLTDEQVQVIRRKMLRLDWNERVKVTFHNDVLERFWNEMAGRERLPREARASFFKLNNVQKAQLILLKVKQLGYPESYAQDIKIEDDPAIMREYITNVWPIIENGCATSGCHSGPKAASIAFFVERVMKPAQHYTNFMMLHEYNSEGKQLINRDMPQESLLLVYGQPRESTAVVHPTEIPTLWRDPNDPRYLKLGRWLDTLRPPAPDFGFKLEKIEQ